MRFWELELQHSLRGLAEWADGREFELEVCSVNSQHRFPYYKTGLSVLLTSKKIDDIVWTWYHDLLVQDRVLRQFREEGFTGFEARPVEVGTKVRAKEPDPCATNPGLKARDAGRLEIPTFWEIVRTGWGGLAPPESGIHLTERCPGCNRQKYSGWTDVSRLVDDTQWDGSDFFIVWPLPVHCFVSDRVAQFIKKQKLTGVRATPVEKMKWPKFLEPGFTPGRLREWMDDERARRIGEPLGIY